MPETAIKVAFASTGLERVDQHFGSAKSFAVYAVGMGHAELLEVAQFGDPAQDGNEDKLAAKIVLLDGAAAVYCQAVGASAVRQLMAQGIQPVKVREGSRIKDLIRDIQNELKSGPSAWLATAVAKQKGPGMGRFDEMEAEGWEE